MIANSVYQSWNKPEKHLTWQFVIMYTPQSVKIITESVNRYVILLFIQPISHNTSSSQ